jgi:hypothetical protein
MDDSYIHGSMSELPTKKEAVNKIQCAWLINNIFQLLLSTALNSFIPV